MPVYNDLDDSDVWQDDESLASTDFSSHAGEDSDYEFLTRTSSQAGTEEDLGEDESDSSEDELPSIYTTTQSVASVDSLSASISPPDDEVLADSVLQSTELPYVVPKIPDAPAMDDSATTIIHESHNQRDRQDTVTATSVSPPQASEPIASKGMPFTIVWSGSMTLKSQVLRKLAQALMTALLHERETSSASSVIDWSSGYTSVVPITEFSPSSQTAPEIEFVEDSLVKLRIRDLDTLHTMPTMRHTRFTVQLDHKSQLITCHHGRGKHVKTTCSWFEMGDETASLIVYCSPTRGEKYDGNQHRIELFAKIHRIPILVISDMDVHRYVSKEFTGAEVIPSARFFELDSLQLGTALWKNAKESKEAIKMTEKDREFRMNLHKRMFLRLVFMILIIAAVLFFRIPFRSASPPPVVQPSYPLANTPTQKELETKFLPSSELMSIPPSTVTVTEQLTVTIPITETKTKTVTTSPTNGPAKHPTSTIVLQAITSSINVPRASLKPRLPDIDYGYACGYDDTSVQLFLETERSLLLRLPKIYRDYPAARPKVRISVTRDSKPVDFELRVWKKNDLAFITWAEADTYGRLEIKVWTEANPMLSEHVLVDYSESIIDPRLWELLGKSQDAAVRRLFKLGEEWDAKVRAMAKDVKDRVSDTVKYAAMEEKMAESMAQMKKYQKEAQILASRHFDEVKSYMSDVWAANQPVLREEWTRFAGMKDRVKTQMSQYIKIAQQEAVRVSERAKRKAFGGKMDDEGEKETTNYWKKFGKRGCTKCGKGGRRRMV